MLPQFSIYQLILLKKHTNQNLLVVVSVINLHADVLVSCMIKIETIPAYEDNYIWCLFDSETRQALVVDPGDAQPVLARLEALNLELAAIFITHHHFDHVGGIEQLLAVHPCTVYGPSNDAIDAINVSLTEGDHVNALGLSFQITCVPGHTLDHIAFYADSVDGGPVLFCGDTLFAGGCGRLFEGDAAMMLGSLEKLGSLPGDTRVCCAHEYTLANLKFANAVEPGNNALQQRITRDTAKREQAIPTVPSLLSLEKATNPFLRCDVSSVIDSAQRKKGSICRDPVEVFATIRSWKDNF